MRWVPRTENSVQMPHPSGVATGLPPSSVEAMVRAAGISRTDSGELPHAGGNRLAKKIRIREHTNPILEVAPADLPLADQILDLDAALILRVRPSLRIEADRRAAQELALDPARPWIHRSRE